MKLFWPYSQLIIFLISYPRKYLIIYVPISITVLFCVSIFFSLTWGIKFAFLEQFLKFKMNFCFWLCHMACGILVQSWEDWTQVLGSETMESQPLDHQGIP